jgi:hypothetical protein
MPIKRGLFINNKKAKDSIFESGYMVYQCLQKSAKYQLDYCEVDANDREIKTGYDFYFFNYHPITMSWLQTRSLKKDLGFVITMILEVAPGDPFVMCPEKHFDVYCALDPTVTSRQKNLFAFPRPLERIDFELPVVHNEVPVIGSFGFATRGKGFQYVVEAVNKEFEKAIVRINIPYGDFVPESESYAYFLGDTCKKLAKPGIEVKVTHDFMSKEELIRWCASNTLNCFLYDRNMPGLSATTDQAIISRQPLSVSDNDTFRHITAYLPPYPSMSLKESIARSLPFVKKMEEDWKPEKFTSTFEEVLFKAIRDTTGASGNGTFVLPLKKKNLADTIEKKIKKYKRKIKRLSVSGMFHRKKANEII